MNLDSFTGPGSTPSRRRFWDKVTAYVIASQKVAGKNVSVSEHEGKGTLINVTRGRAAAGNPCDNLEAASINLHVEGVTSCPGLFDCIDVNGDWMLPFFDSGTWELDQEFDCGPFPITLSFIVDCTGGAGFAVNITVGGTTFWFSGVGATWPAAESNVRTCDFDAGSGGTASISL